jgi:hypothetical protein
MSFRRSVIIALATVATACNTQDKKPRIPEQAVVGTWRSDTVSATDATTRVYELRMAPDGLAEFTSQLIGKSATLERGTWDGADSLVRVLVRGDATASRPTSLLLAIRRTSLRLVEFDTTAWGPTGLILHRR